MSVGKREFYRGREVVADYDRRRFGGRSGAWVNHRELSLIGDLVPPGGRILDLGCGTGRAARYLAGRGDRVVGLDSSEEMLRLAVAGSTVVAGDAFALPFGPDSFDAVVALRLAFHYPDLCALLDAVRAILAPGGRIVFDSYNWSPRTVVALDRPGWGGKVFAHRPSDITAAATAAGFEVTAKRPAFLFSPYLYRLLPYPCVAILASFERSAPRLPRARVFWGMMRQDRKPSDLAPH
jgi:SAM-dependent methyltransferase